jgi:hypothetical protein
VARLRGSRSRALASTCIHTVGFARLESDGSPFHVVGIVSLVRRAVLRSFAPGLQGVQ